MAKKSDTYVKQIQNIERLEIMEDKYGVRFEGVNATFQLYNENTGQVVIDVYGEIQALNGTGIVDDLSISAIVYGSDGKVLGSYSTSIESDKFFALCPIRMIFFIGNYQEPAKLRIYPTKA